MKRFKDILCVVATGEACQAALDSAVTLAENNQASLMVVDVTERVTAGIGMPVGGPISLDLQAAIVTEHEHVLETLVDPYRARIDIETKVLVGTPFLEIIREVLRNGHDLVIKLPQTRDWLDRLFGSNDMHLFRKCPCPVWAIKPQSPKPYRRILAAVDLGESYPPEERNSRRTLNQQIIEMASSLALSDFAELHIVFAWEEVGERVMRSEFVSTPEEEITAYAEQARRQHAARLDGFMHEVSGTLGSEALEYIKPRTHLVRGWADKQVPVLAKRIEADLVVMGTVARTGISGFFMGNTAETILDQLECSVLAVKPHGFLTPVTLED